MVDQIIRPYDLPNRANPVASEKVPVDNGVTVGGATIKDIVASGRPAASQAEAEAGVNPEKAMTPLTTRQFFEKNAVVSVVAGDNVTVTGTPNNPVINASGELSAGSRGDVSVISPATDWRLNRTYDTVESLLLDDGDSGIGMGYAGSGAPVIVAPGDVVLANQFPFDVAPEGAGNLDTAGGVALYLRRNADLTVYSEQAGITAATTSATAINKMLADAVQAGAHTVKFSDGEWEPDARIDLPIGLREVNGQNSRWVRNITSGSSWNDTIFRYSDTLETLPALSADIDSASEVIPFVSPHDLEVGDVIGFRNTTPSSLNAWRPTYYDGQPTIVREVVSPTEVTVFDVIDPRGALKVFPAATTQVCRYRKRSRGFSLRDIDLVGNLNPFGLCRLEGLSFFELENIRATGGQHTTFSIGLSAYGESENLYFNHTAPVVGTQYGLGLDATSFHKGRNVVAFATRHAISHGNSDGLGSLPPRGNQYLNVNLGSELAEALDFGHGNILDHRVQGGTVTGLAIGGDNNFVDLDSILVPPTYFSGCRAIATANLHGVNQRIRVGKIVAPGTGTHSGSTYADGIVGIGGSSQQMNANTVDGGTFDVEIGRVEARKWTNASAILTRWVNRGFTGQWGVKMHIGQIVCPSQPDWWSMGNVSGTAPILIDIDPGPDRFDPSAVPVHGWTGANRGMTGFGVASGGQIKAPVISGSVVHAGGAIAAGTTVLISITGFSGLSFRDSVEWGSSVFIGANLQVSAWVAAASTVAILVSNVSAASATLAAVTWSAYVSKRP